jgi:hypothetical protein
MELNHEVKKQVQELGDAINSAIESSARVVGAIEKIRAQGYEPYLSLKLEIGLSEIGQGPPKAPLRLGDLDIEFTDEDAKIMQSMRIRLDDFE